MNQNNSLNFLGLITSVGSGWLSCSSTLQVIGLNNSSKFSKFIRLFGYIDNSMSKGLHLEPKNLGWEITSYFHFIEIGQTSQGNTALNRSGS